MTGWWLSHPAEKYYIVNWDDDSQYMEKIFETISQMIFTKYAFARVDLLIKKLRVVEGKSRPRDEKKGKIVHLWMICRSAFSYYCNQSRIHINPMKNMVIFHSYAKDKGNYHLIGQDMCVGKPKIARWSLLRYPHLKSHQFQQVPIYRCRQIVPGNHGTLGIAHFHKKPGAPQANKLA